VGDPSKETQDPASLVDETLEEHSSCMKLVSELEACLDRRPDDPVRWVTELTDQLSGLTGALGRHFEREEAGPIFRTLPTRHPRLAQSLADLEAEHSVMLLELRDVVSTAEALESPELFEVRELNARVQLFVARIRRHEAAENELVVQAYWDEVGVGD
jgi:hemerythrin-like domain-containing protein